MDSREGVNAAIVDVRPADEFVILHVMGSINLPASTFSAADIEGVCYPFMTFSRTGQQNTNLFSFNWTYT